MSATGGDIALDTNAAIAVLNDAPGAGDWISGFDRVFLPTPVVGELRFGAMKSRRADENLARVAQLVAQSFALEVDLTTTEFYARIRHQLRRAGTPIPENDVWIAAICTQHSLEIASVDTHFGRVEGLRVVSFPGAA